MSLWGARCGKPARRVLRGEDGARVDPRPSSTHHKIKVLKRMGYGYRDDGYFFLKIMAAFPGNPENAG